MDTRTDPTTAPHDTRLAYAPQPNRHDGYAGIHKALRLYMSNTLTRVGSTDPFDAEAVDATLNQVRELLETCELHVKDENEFIHPALEHARPGSAARIREEHVHHIEEIEDLRDLACLAADTSGAARVVSFGRLYRALALFVAENFEHMHVEESEHNPLLWAYYTDAELIAIERALVASIPPTLMVRTLHWFMPGLNAPERAGMLGGMKMGMPPEAFLGVLDIARRTIPTHEFAKLAAAVGVPV